MQTRREVLRALSGSAAILAGCVAPTRSGRPERRSDGEWAAFRRDDANTGCARDEDGPTAGPSVRWTVETEAPVWGSPAVADGTVYVGSQDRHLYAIDAATGDVDWRFPTGGPIQGTPAIVDDTVYFGSFDRHVYALDVETGEERWSYVTPGLIQSSPTIAGDTLYVGSGSVFVGAAAVFLQESDVEQRGGGLFALDRRTGSLRWQSLEDVLVTSTPAIAGDAVVVGSTDDRIYAFEADDGETRWWYGTEDFVLSSPAVRDGTVYVPDYDGFVYAIDVVTGDPDWEFDTDGFFISGSPAICGGSIYVPVSGTPDPTDSLNGMLFALSMDGEQRWMHKFAAPLMGSSPAVTDDALYVGTHSQIGTPKRGCYGLDLDGKRYWSYELERGEGVGSSPALVDGTLYFGADDGTVYALA